MGSCHGQGKLFFFSFFSYYAGMYIIPKNLDSMGRRGHKLIAAHCDSIAWLAEFCT